jgi:hypothetical protein
LAKDKALEREDNERISETNINGCNNGSYSRMAKRCRECNNKEYCSNKRLEAAEAIGEAMRKIYCGSRT